MDRVQPLFFKCLSSDAIIKGFLVHNLHLFCIVYFGVEMLEQSVKLSRLIIFYFISNFLIYAPILPKRDPKTSAFRSVFVFRAVFQLLYSCFGRKENVLQTPTIAVFETGPEADPNFAPFRWRIWLAPSEFLCLLANQNATFVTLFCTQLPFFCTVLPKNCIPLSQSQSRNFLMYIIMMKTRVCVKKMHVMFENLYDF